MKEFGWFAQADVTCFGVEPLWVCLNLKWMTGTN